MTLSLFEDMRRLTVLLFFCFLALCSEDQVYSILYLDAREEMANQLTEAERKQILDEFDEIDTSRTGVVTAQGQPSRRDASYAMLRSVIDSD